MRLERFKTYKDSGINWIGETPEHWSVKRIKDIFKEFGSGTTPQSSNPRYYEGGIIPWLNTSDLNNGIVTTTKVKVTEEALVETSLKLYKKDSLAIAMYGQGKTRGTVGLMDFEFTTNQASCVMQKPQRNTYSKYVLYWFNHKYEDIRAINSGSAQPNMNQDFVRFLQLHYPPFHEQVTIANYLDKKTVAVDRKIELLEQKTLYYKELRKSLINETICRGLNKDANLKDSGIDWIGKIPEHWEIKRIKDISNVVGRIGFRGYTTADIVNEGVGAISLSPSNIENQSLVLIKKTYISVDKYEESPEIKIFNGDIIFVKTASVGKVAYVEGLSEDATINPQLIAFKNIQIYSKFLYYLCISKVIQTQVEFDIFGGVINTITQTSINNYKCLIPKLGEQKKIVEYLDYKANTIDQILSNIDSQIKTLKELRKTLINDVVTGKVKVSEVVEENVMN